LSGHAEEPDASQTVRDSSRIVQRLDRISHKPREAVAGSSHRSGSARKVRDHFERRKRVATVAANTEREFRNDRPAPPDMPVCPECACWDDDMGPCEWAEPDLCSFCQNQRDDP